MTKDKEQKAAHKRHCQRWQLRHPFIGLTLASVADLDRLTAHCEREGRSKAWVIRRALGEYLERAEGGNVGKAAN